MPFRPLHDGTIHLTQPEREAVVDLLHLCLYADAHISLKEEAFIANVVDVIGWDPQTSFGSYEARSIAAVRTAKDTEPGVDELLASVSARLATQGARLLGVDLCRQLLAADGTTVEPESVLLRRIRAAMD